MGHAIFFYEKKYMDSLSSMIENQVVYHGGLQHIFHLGTGMIQCSFASRVQLLVV